MNIAFTGKIIAAEPYQQGTSQRGTQWCSQNFIIEELNQQYPSRAVFQVYGSDKLQQFNIQVGEVITAHISPKAHQGKDGRWFNQLDCWKVERFGAQKPQAYTPPAQPTYQQPQQQPQQQQTYQSAIGQTTQLDMMQPQGQQLPPTSQRSRQPTNQQPTSGGSQPQQGGLPFPPMS